MRNAGVIFVPEKHRMKIKVLHKIVAYLLIAAFTMFVVNQTFFLHTHKLPDGTIITHAHPYNKTTEHTPYKTHHHTSVDFMMLHHINLLFFVVFAFSLVLAQRMHLVRFAYLVKNNSTYDLSSVFGRAPPLLT